MMKRSWILKMTKIYYLAHPYSPSDGSHPKSPQGSGIIEGNLHNSIKITNELLDKGYYIFNPLTHSHYLHKQKERDSDFWYDLDLEFLGRFNGIILCPGWDLSKGCKKEFQLALAISKSSKFEILFYEDIIKEV